MSDRLEAAPLYRQVGDLLATRIDEGFWQAGEMLPNEFELADQFNVSQGTVRKALGTLETRGIVERRQGRGTFVTTNTDERSFYHFFRLAHPGGERVKPEPFSEKIRRRKANKREREQLGTAQATEVFEIIRVRKVGDQHATRETMLIPCDIAPTLSEIKGNLPNSLYPFYQQQFGTMVLRAEEYIAAVAASEVVAQALQVTAGTPVLEVTRTAHDIKDRVVELRVSQFRSDTFNYNVTLR
jgi:GntR family transcriptional regulator